MSRSWGSLSLTLSHGTVSQAVGHQKYHLGLYNCLVAWFLTKRPIFRAEVVVLLCYED